MRFYLAFLPFILFSFKTIFSLHLKLLIGIRKASWDNDCDSLWRFFGLEMLLPFVLGLKKNDVADGLFLTFPCAGIVQSVRYTGSKIT